VANSVVVETGSRIGATGWERWTRWSITSYKKEIRMSDYKKMQFCDDLRGPPRTKGARV